MDYQQYISLKFERYDLNDTVEFKKSGYRGYALTYKLSEDLLIQVHGGELDKPMLLMRKKQDRDSYHYLPITTDRVALLIVDYLKQGAK